MSAKKPEGPDLSQGAPLADIADGSRLLGHIAGEAVLLARRGQELFAIGAECPSRPVPSRCGWGSGNDVPHIHYLRSLPLSRAIIAKATASRRHGG